MTREGRCPTPFYRGGKIAGGLAIALVCLVLVIGRLVADQVQSYRIAQEYLAQKNAVGAVVSLGRVLDAHIPLSPWEERASGQLLALAEALEAAERPREALLAFETWRSSRHLSRHWTLPDAVKVSGVEDRIARLKAGLSRHAGSDPGAAYIRHLRLLRRDYSPSIVWSATCAGLFIAEIVMAALWAWRGGAGLALGALACMAGWLLALWNA